MSTPELVANAIKSKIEAILPAYKLSQYLWDTSQNSDSKSEKFYAVRPGSASFVSGTCRTITLEQSFEVEFGESYRNKRDKDSDANDKVMSLYEAHETLYKEIMRENFNIGRVQVVSELDIESPEVDNENKVCRIVATFTIRYRTE